MENEYVGKFFSNLALFSQDFEASPRGSFKTDKAIDGVGRIIGYSKIVGLPLVVATTIPVDSVLAGWRERVRIYAIVAIIAFMALVTLSLVVRRTTSREEQVKHTPACRDQRVSSGPDRRAHPGAGGPQGK
jgi:hypothetical protein